MNVLVYNGPGTTPGSVKHATESLRDFLEPYYAVSTVTSKVLETEPWMGKTSAIVFPGGADLPYVRECKPIIPKLKEFVSKKGGVFIGFCAGGYFGGSRVEFAQGDLELEVTGNRELQLFPGIVRGPAYAGFKYNSEVGARATKMQVNNGTMTYNYINGGGVFVDADSMPNVEVLAHFTEPLDVSHVQSGPTDDNPAAVVLCHVGKGKVLLTGSHPEFLPKLLAKSPNHDDMKNIIELLQSHEKERLDFMRYILTKMGLNCNRDFNNVRAPNLTPIVVASSPMNTSKLIEFKTLLQSKFPNSKQLDNSIEIKDATDYFHFFEGFERCYELAKDELHDQDPETVAKAVVFINENEAYPSKETLHNFDMETYFKHLNPNNNLGSLLMYSEVVTSTSSLLNNNKTLLSAIPKNSVLHVGTIQVSGRGRGGNVWINPKGVAAATAVVNLPLKSPTTQENISIVFVQYLSMLAYCKAINSYLPGFEDLPVRIKWPNDLYCMSPSYYRNNNIKLLGKGLSNDKVTVNDIEPAYLKISGLLVNTHFLDNGYTLLLGCGINVSTDGPTTSLNTWVDILNKEREEAGLVKLPHIDVEILQALYMNNLEVLLKMFVDYGSSTILPEYYRYWLHSNQIVTLTSHQNIRAKITGITSDYGLLIAEELMPGSDYKLTGVVYHLQPDGNTFDIFRGLIAKKVT
ncbi:biotin--[acetyl-CoA-carboxylase] ligase BPL1 KNAG_0C03960 [Huiozyma naganishii CBS 8797]|uniref:BPL/LPL catalytic domain-containing protein n=1 Tax=Huiozyma naganishii (strain ATCC MYA-139 / BCRC 22969 / CBS 8797 / KCTC 17520 / NBRC 10181 / NCYC 3082 / Yp74L-3) TaxID=1071383 RepID=J7R3V3_HUIN7|nr:hypothetical protein KNAG_0C03960 [Kazachstania naganishii CBS 8797]CCK69500.1 hypothetical protein KNAG_0C03960 [Kazachstania naganishii CBS 8797]